MKKTLKLQPRRITKKWIRKLKDTQTDNISEFKDEKIILNTPHLCWDLVLECSIVNLVKGETIHPKIPFPVWYCLKLTKRRTCRRLGRWKWSTDYYSVKIIIIRWGEIRWDAWYFQFILSLFCSKFSASLLQFLLINNYSRPITKLLPSDYQEQVFLEDFSTSFPFMIPVGAWMCLAYQMEWLVIRWSSNYSSEPFNSSAPSTSV